MAPAGPIYMPAMFTRAPAFMPETEVNGASSVPIVTEPAHFARLDREAPTFLLQRQGHYLISDVVVIDIGTVNI